MIGDLIIKLREKWHQLWCIHTYKYKDLPAGCSFFRCTKCGRIKKLTDYGTDN